MQKNTYRKAITMLILSLCTTGVYATTSYFSEGYLSLEVIGFKDSAGNNYDFGGQSATITILNTDNGDDKEYSASTIGDAFAEGLSSPFSDSGLLELGTQASGYAGSVYAYAQSDATTSASFKFENTSVTEDYMIDLILGYSFSGNVETDNPEDVQNGLSSIDINLFGDSNLDEILAISEQRNLDDTPFSGFGEQVPVSFLLAAGETENVFASIYSYGESESVSAVPLPASIFLMGPALMALIVRRKVAAVQ